MFEIVVSEGTTHPTATITDKVGKLEEVDTDEPHRGGR
jgi:hypothetical protein